MPATQPTNDNQAINTKLKPLYPIMDSLKSVIDLAYSQMPEVPANVVFNLFMVYHNTLLAQLKKEQEHG